jgi:predicted HTH transcriptional regulator
MTAAPLQSDLFGHRPKPKYPDVPGWRGTDTSRAAAKSMEESAPNLEERCLRVLREKGPMTPDEIANELGIDKLSIRPRISTLKRKGLVKDTGERRENKSGRDAYVVEAVPLDEIKDAA